MTLVEGSGLAIAGRLEPCSLGLRGGELTCLVGPNGSGKTSLLQSLAGIPPSLGEVLIGAENPKRQHPDRRQRLLSYLPASRDVLWPLLARDLIALNLPPGVDGSTAAQALELEPFLDRRVDSLSTGERTRVLIARALAPEPRLLLLDEPIANLDPYWQLFVLERLRNVAAAGTAILLTIHDLAAVRAFADRVLVMAQGRIAGDGTPEEILSSELIARIFGVEWSSGGWGASRTADPRSSQ